MTIRALCITEDPDRPTLATFMGLSRAGIEMSVAGPLTDRQREALQAASVRIVDLSFKRRLDRSAIRRLRAELVKGRYDILHLFNNKPLQNGLIATRGMPVRIIAYRGIVGNVSFFSPISWLRFLNPRIDRIVCVADAVRDYFLSMWPPFLRMPESRLVRIYKGHSLDWYDAEPANLGSLGIPDDAFVVSLVANYRPRKGFEVLVDAIAQLPAEMNIHALIVGHIDSKRFEDKVAESPCGDRIHCVGHRDDAPSLVAASDVFVLPSVKREGLSRALIEAMAYARPVVVTDCGGSPELVIDGECGLVVPVRDPGAIAGAIRELFEDPVTRFEFGRAARRRIGEHFRIEDTIAQTLELYRSLVSDVASS